MSHDEIAVIKLMQSRGLRVTDQRLLILDAVCAGAGHITIGEIMLRVKAFDSSIDQSTVYRALDLFCKLGVIAVNPAVQGGMVYEIVGRTPHHHLRCTACGREYDIPHTLMQPLIERIQQEYGFTVNAPHLMLDGICQTCRQSLPVEE